MTKGCHITVTGRGRGPLVSYRVISADSHPVSGAFTYSVGAPSTPPVDSGADSRADPVVGNGIKVAKYLGYVGLALLVGAALVLAVLWPRRLPRSGPARLAWAGLGLVALYTVASALLQVPYTNGGTFDVHRRGPVRHVGQHFGAAHLARLGLLARSGFLLRPLFAGRWARTEMVILGVLGGAAAGDWPVSGHRRPRPPGPSVVVDAVHLAAWPYGWAAWRCSPASCCVTPTSGTGCDHADLVPLGGAGRQPPC